MRRRGGYRRGFMQRFSCYGRDVLPAVNNGPSRVWIHAVSVGEMLVALRFLDALRHVFPGRELVITTNTSTAHALAARRLQAGDKLLYFPLDLSWFMRRAFRRIDPGLILLIECELWPNLLREAVRRDIPVAIANARLSDRSFKGYRCLGFFFRRVAGMLTAVYAQTKRDAQRFRELGLPEKRIHVAGNAKYDLAFVDPASVRIARRALADAGIKPAALTVLGGSTWPGEEEVLMEMLPRLRQAAAAPVVLVLAPRHVERCPEIRAAVRRRGLTMVTRSETRHSRVSHMPDILLVDTTGELQQLYAAATVVFVGKSLTASGGQNPIEPAACGGAVVVGPFTGNFTAVISDLRAAGAIVVVNNAEELEKKLIALLCDRGRRETLGRNAVAAVQRYRGAIERTVRQLPSPRA